MKCENCKKEIEKDQNGWDKGNNGWPLVEGRVCNECNKLVLKKRLEMIDNGN